MRQRLRLDRTRALLATGITLAATAGAIGTAQAVTPAPTQSVSFLGHTFQVPGDWPVINLTDHPTTCVRFDQHAVYLGTPGTAQDCPAHLSGRTEALLVEPQGDSATVTTDNQAAGEVVGVAPHIKATATYDKGRGQARAMLRQAGLAPVTGGPVPKPTTAPTTGAVPAVATGGAQAVPATFTTSTGTRAQALATPAASFSIAVAPNTTDYTGNGFDACTAPAQSSMDAWLSGSPYRTVGVYIGGHRACSQPNLTASWVHQQAANGWHFLPTYVGTQASSITDPAGQGAQAADDAANQAAALGFLPGSTLYDDMENYSSTYSSSVLAFLSAWTNELHVRGYHSGVYSSANSGITDLVNNAASYTMPDVVWDARWNNTADTNDPVIPSYYWSNHQRAHQYAGDVTETYNGVTISIDRDYLDVAASGMAITANSRMVATVENGALHDVYPAADGWHDDTIPNVGGSVTSVSESYLNGFRTEAVVEGGTLHNVYLVSDGWHDDPIAIAGTSVSAVSQAYSPSGVRAFEVLEGGVLHEVYADAAGWHDGVIPTSGGPTTTIALAYKTDGTRVIEAIENGMLHEIYADSAGWHDGVIAGVAAGATTVSFAIMPDGNRDIEAIVNGQLHEVYSDSAGWHDGIIWGAGSSASAISMVRRSDGTRVIEAAESGALHEIYSASDGWHDNAVGGVGGGIMATSLAYH